jgi:hypothetical protein
LISDTKLLSPGTAPVGRAPTCDNRELTNPDGSAGVLVGRAFRSETKLPRPEAAPDGMAAS